MAKKRKPKKSVSSPQSPKKTQQQLSAIFQQFHHSFAAGDYQTAIKQALLAHRLSPRDLKPLSDATTCAIYLEQWDKAIELADKVLKLDRKNINALDGLSHAYGSLGQWQEVKRYSGQALMLRDQPFALAAQDNPPPPIHIDKARITNGKKLIAFSLYGDNSAYNEPAVMNAELQARIYPDWQCRFYIDDSVSQTTIQRLKTHQAEVIIVDETQKKLPGTMWRFLALDDPNVGRVIFRDADSVISEREAVAVTEWEKDGSPFHLIRDSGSHTELILAGLWGAVAGAVESISEAMYQYIEQQGERLSSRFADQYFLRERLWQTVRENALTHSSCFDFMNAKPLPPATKSGHKTDHIGNDEGNSNFFAQNEHPDGIQLYWSLYTTLSPYISLNDEQAKLSEERLICTYPAIQTNGQITGKIPRRYAHGIGQGESRISLSTQPPSFNENN